MEEEAEGGSLAVGSSVDVSVAGSGTAADGVVAAPEMQLTAPSHSKNVW